MRLRVILLVETEGGIPLSIWVKMEQTRECKQGMVAQVRNHPVKGKPSRNICLPSSYKIEGAGDYSL